MSCQACGKTCRQEIGVRGGRPRYVNSTKVVFLCNCCWIRKSYDGDRLESMKEPLYAPCAHCGSALWTPDDFNMFTAYFGQNRGESFTMPLCYSCCSSTSDFFRIQPELIQQELCRRMQCLHVGSERGYP